MRTGFFRMAALAAVVGFGLSMSGRADERYSSGEEAYLPTLLNGDWNGDGDRNVTDLINMLHWLYLGDAESAVRAACHPASSGPPGPLGPSSAETQPENSSAYIPTHRNGDLNGNGRINITDVLILSEFLFLGGYEPAPIECELQEK